MVSGEDEGESMRVTHFPGGLDPLFPVLRRSPAREECLPGKAGRRED